MIKILYLIDGLRAGGKERRFLSLIKKIALSNKYKIEAIILNENIHYKEYKDININFYTINRKNHSFFGVISNIYEKALKFNPDIIHSWDTLSTIYSIPISKFFSCKLITSKITDSPPKFNLLSRYGFLSNICFYFSDLILSNSHSGIKSYRVSKKKSRVIYNGFDFKRLELNEFNTNLDIPKKYKYIVSMVASFSKNKDYKTFLSCAQNISKKREDILFLCIGDGILRKKLQKEFNEKSIKFLGKRNDVESLVNISNIGVLISNNENHGEGISNSLMEFMAFGKPVIASDNGGNKELIINNETGFILQKNSCLELEKLILKLICDERLMKSMGNNAKKRILNSFNIDDMINNFKIAYNNILND